MTTNPKTPKRQAERTEARINKMLALLAVRPRYRDELAREMSISLGTLIPLVKYARAHGWIVAQGKYYINPHNVMVADGKIVKNKMTETIFVGRK